MANNIDTTQIVDPTKQQPFLGGSLAFLQSGNKELIRGICRSMMGEANYALSSTKVIILSGCNFNAGLTTIFEGLMFYGDEAFYFPGASGLGTYVNIPVIKTDITNVSPDPITFSDGSTGNVHEQRRLKVVDDVSGSGICDLKDAIYLSQNNGTSGLLGSYSTTGATQESVTGATYTTPKGLVGMSRKWKITYIGNIQPTIVNGASAGGKFAIRNSTTSTDLAVNYVDTIGTVGTAGLSLQTPFTIEFEATLAPNTTIIGTIQRTGAANQTLQNGYWLVKEIN